MLYKIMYYYDSSVNLDNVAHHLVEELSTGEVVEAISKCLELKQKGEPIPVGFSIITYDEYDLNDCETKNYYINGTIIDKTNFPQFWEKNILNKDVRKLVYINDNFCIPFDDSEDTVLRISNL